MAVSHGKAGVLKVNSVELPHITSVSPNFELPTSDSTAMGDAWQDMVSGIPGAALEIAGWLDPTNSTGNDGTLFDALVATAAVPWEWGPNGDANGALKYSGSCYVSKYQPAGEVASTVAFTATLTVKGAVTRGTYSA